MHTKGSLEPETTQLRQALELSKPIILEILQQADPKLSIKNIRAKHWDEKNENCGLIPITLRTHTDIDRIFPLLQQILDLGAYPLRISDSNPKHNEIKLYFIGNEQLSQNQIRNAQLTLYLNKLLHQLRKVQTQYKHKLKELEKQSKASDNASFITHIVELIRALKEEYKPQIEELQTKIRITEGEKQETSSL